MDKLMKSQMKNVVFDMGNVLLDFSIDKVLSAHFPEENDRALIRGIVFESGEWNRLDAGEFEEAEALARWLVRTPQHLREALRDCFVSWHTTLTPIEGMAELIAELKQKGYGCYLLSNTSVRFDTYWKDFEALRSLDGRFISAHYKQMKPDVAIYQKMCEVFSLRPWECLFVDDRRENVEGAIKAGMRSVWFETYDVVALRQKMRAEGIDL